MKWKLKPDPNEGDKKTVKKFALFPVRIGDTAIWLEYYFIYYVWITGPSYPFWLEINRYHK